MSSHSDKHDEWVTAQVGLTLMSIPIKASRCGHCTSALSTP